MHACGEPCVLCIGYTTGISLRDIGQPDGKQQHAIFWQVSLPIKVIKYDRDARENLHAHACVLVCLCACMYVHLTLLRGALKFPPRPAILALFLDANSLMSSIVCMCV